MKALFVAAVLAVGVSPVMAGNGWGYGSNSSLIDCKPNTSNHKYNNYDSWSYRSNHGSNYGSNYGSYYGSRVGSLNHNHRPTSSYNVWPARYNSSSSYYDYNAPSVRNVRYENQSRYNLSFSPWTPTRSYNNYRYGY